jgi:hypothetical protein
MCSNGHLGGFVCDMVCSPYFGHEMNHSSDAKQLLNLVIFPKLQTDNKFIIFSLT